jgi:hypothetical protein
LVTEDAASADRARSEEVIRAQNIAAESDVANWLEFTLRWRTRRWWPTEIGWLFVAAICGFLAMAIVIGQSSRGQGIFAVVFATAGIGVNVVLLNRPVLEMETADYEMTIAPQFLRLTKKSPGSAPLVTEIQRVGAGTLHVDIVAIRRSRGFAGRGFALPGINQFVQSVTGTSVDGGTVITVEEKRIHDKRLLGFWPGTFPADVLVAWWPANEWSAPALRRYVAAGFQGWTPPCKVLAARLPDGTRRN